MDKRNKFRLIALAVAAYFILSGLFGLLTNKAEAAAPTSGTIFSIKAYDSASTTVRSLTQNQNYTIEFEYYHDVSSMGVNEGDLKIDNFTVPTTNNSAFTKRTGSNGTELELTIKSIDDNIAQIEGKITNIRCSSRNYHNLVIDVSGATAQNGASYSASGNDKIIISTTSYFDAQGGGSGSSGSSDDDNPYSSNIVIENVYVTDADGVRIDKIDKDSPPFTLVVTYFDRGLREVDDDEFNERSLEVYLTEPGGFVASQGQKGTLRYMSSTSNDAPRFRASFPNVTYDEVGGSSISITAYYDVYGYEVEGKSPTWRVAAVDEDDDDKKLSPLTPHIIVNQYSYGNEAIVAGGDFTLSLSITNTSADIPLENIVMTIAPYIPENNTSSTTGGLTITSASNTQYIPSLGVGESYSHSIDLRAEPSAAVGSHKIEIDFTFQYVDEVNEERKDSTDAESIAIPVVQVDRFSVDPITEIPSLLMTGEEGYITVTFVNRGKSVTQNVSGTITGNTDTNGQSQHFGHVPAGESGTLDFEVVSYEPGIMHGEITIQYEDESTNQNEVVLPFSITVEAMDVPPMDDFPDDWEMMEPETGVGAFTVILCVLGGLMMAAPIALYLYKRVKIRGIEAMDEDF